MKMIIQFVAVSISAILLISTSARAEVVVVDWDSADSGTLNGISVTFDPSGAWLSSADLSGANYSFAPLLSSQETVDYSCGNDWTLTFGQSVSGLLLYLVSWRGLEGGADPMEYTFDSSFSIVSGLIGSTVTGTTLNLPAFPNYYSGIIKFNNPLATLNVVSNSSSGNLQAITIAYEKTGFPWTIFLPPIIGNQPKVKTVTSLTGRIWMDRNLGATRMAIGIADTEAYGDLYQWGRLLDGHEKRTSGITVTLSANDTPGHGDFIINDTSSPYDWRNPANDDLWQNGINAINNPCPDGFRLPTKTELQEEVDSWSSKDATGAFASPLKFVMAGYRGNNDEIYSTGGMGLYWSSTVDSNNTNMLEFYDFADGDAFVDGGFYRACGLSIRCIKE